MVLGPAPFRGTSRFAHRSPAGCKFTYFGVDVWSLGSPPDECWSFTGTGPKTGVSDAVRLDPTSRDWPGIARLSPTYVPCQDTEPKGAGET